ncbi:hypothetical protein [Hymenobacter sp. DG25A]|uniref:hypothetical protein n=1 Tax=Hymenobacter sp. DG25A TaxID=1385663 RepID=UPI0006C885F0|nr:hypothetical protein [Hymenobacter sp. DG25A]
MTRASLLQILDHVTSISEAETRELEQLAATFPYCQTAHLLLAKAAHDHGSMLASQRLRHAATYAADRQLLRELIEQQPQPTTPFTAAPAPITEPEPTVAAEAPNAPVEEDPSLQPTEESAPLELASPLVSEIEASPDSPAAESEVETAAETAIMPAASVEAVAEEVPVVSEAAIDEVVEDEDTTVEALAEAPENSSVPDVEEKSATADLISSEAESSPEVAEASAETDPIAGALLDELPPVAPPIRPPADAGSSRFEYGFEEPAPVAPPVLYQLPEVEDVAIKAAIPAFFADSELGYDLPYGSRLGYALLPRSEETVDLPLTAFFEPDALLLAHAQANRPAPPPAPSSFELINRFLKVQPRLKAPATLPPVDEQQDLSVRSTSIVPQLASESLAKILVRQGKVAKAIEIYEQLMVRQPEKKTYFADQINQLKLSE